MATQPTQNPVPSESPRDLKFNAGKIDEFVTSLVNTYVDRFGNEHYTIEGLRWLAQQAISQYGWIPLGTFQAGATITLPNQILKDTTDGEYYRWDGALPKSVPSGSTPASSGGAGAGAWISVGSSALRQELSGNGGDRLVGSSFGGTVYSDYQLSPMVKKAEFGKIGSITSAKHAVYYPSEGLWYATKSTTFPITVPTAPDSTWRCVGLLNGYPIYDVRNWGLVGDDLTDNTANFIQMLSKIKSDYLTIEFPAGIFRYTNLGKITKSRITLAGKGSMQTVLKCMNSSADHVAFDIDAWPDPVNPSQPYVDAFNLRGIHIEGNSATLNVIVAQGISRCIWDDVSVWGTKATGTGITMKSVQLGRFSNLMCSKYRNLSGQTVNAPQLGMLMTVGTRAGGGEGSPTNNNFISLYMEGMSRGLNMTWGDGNQFLGGSCEANSDYGTNISSNCRFNTFIGMGNENLNASTGDFIDRGRYSKFLNCYSSQRFVAQGFNGLIDGGYFELIEVQSVAIGYEVKNAAINNWNTGAGGFTDVGSGTRKRSIYDIDTSNFINTTDVRTAVTMSLTPVSGGTRGTWLNDTRLPCTVYIQGTASITQATVSRGADAVIIPTSPVQAVRLEAGDTLTLTWSSSGSGPSLSRGLTLKVKLKAP